MNQPLIDRKLLETVVMSRLPSKLTKKLQYILSLTPSPDVIWDYDYSEKSQQNIDQCLVQRAQDGV